MNLGGRESGKLNMSLFIVRILWMPIIYYIFYLLFYKKEFYFTISLNK